MEHVLDYKADIVFITETWMTSNKNRITATVKDYGYTLYHNIREHDSKSRGGGVGLLCSATLDVKKRNLKITCTFQSFEYCVYSLKTKTTQGKNCPVILCTVYRDQYIELDIFLEEFQQLLQKLILTNNFLIISGDFNVHWDSPENNAVKFSEVLKLYNMKQHVTEPTNAFNNILDLVITSNYNLGKSYKCPAVFDTTVSNVHLSDHFLVSFKVGLEGLQKKKKVVHYRHFKSMNLTSFKDDLSCLISENLEKYREASFGTRVKVLNSSLKDTLDFHAPLKQKEVKIVAGSTWFNHEYVMMRRERRRAEKRAKKSGLTVDHDIYVELRKKTTKFAKSQKHANIKNKLDSTKGDQKALYNVFHRLVDQTNETVLPDHDNDNELANEFAQFFAKKVKNIRNSLSEAESFDCDMEYEMFNGKALYEFEPTNAQEIKSIISEHGLKCSTADILPPDMMYENLDLFLPIWVDLVNASLNEGSMEGLKLANINPKIKEYDLDYNLKKNYRPVSNLEFLSKLIERVVLKRLDSHMMKNELNIGNQSGYKKGHSTETLLIKITNDLLIASDKDTASVLLLLDLSAAFDTVDVNKLLDILFMEIGIRGNALNWFKSFLIGRSQRVKIGNSFSEEIILEFGVPQGSVLGPVLFNIYIRSFYRFVNLKSDFSVQGFADDHQLMTSFSIANQVYMLGENIVNVLFQVKQWMNGFFLKLNEKKTKIIVFAPKRLRKFININGMFLDEKCIRFPNVAYNLGVLLDGELSFKEQISHCVQSCYSTIRQISGVKTFLSADHRKILLTSLVLSRLDYCNGLFYNVNTSYLKQLQAVQNCAAKLIFNRRKYDTGLSNLFTTLHWLKVKERIMYKILLLVHKCLYCKSPTYLNELLTLTYGFVRTGNLVCLKTKYAGSDGAFSICGPKLWNKLPTDLKFESSTIQFKRKLKTYLFNLC